MFYNLLTHVGSMVESLPYRIQEAESNNIKKQKLSDNRNKIIKTLNTLRQRNFLIGDMIKEINTVLKDSQENRKEFIQDRVESGINAILQENYHVELVFKPYKDEYRGGLLLYIIDEKGEKVYLNPRTQNGGLCRQLIAVTSGLAIAELKGVKDCFLDEAFNGGDSASLRRSQFILENFSKIQDCNIILNEHNSTIYHDMPCTIVDIHKEGEGFTGHVVIDEYSEVAGDKLEEIEYG